MAEEPWETKCDMNPDYFNNLDIVAWFIIYPYIWFVCGEQ